MSEISQAQRGELAAYRDARDLTAICPRSESRVFREEAVHEAATPVRILCRACGRWHVWQPDRHALIDLDDREQAEDDDAAG